MDWLVDVHRFFGYFVSVFVLVRAFVGFGNAKNSAEFRVAPYRVAYALLGLQVLLGIIVYGAGGYWDAAPLIAYVHPVLGVLAIGLGQMMLGRARKLQMVTDAHRVASRGLVVSFVLIAAGIGVASAA